MVYGASQRQNGLTGTQALYDAAAKTGPAEAAGATKVRDAQNTMRLRTHRGARFLLAVAVFDLTRFDSPHQARLWEHRDDPGSSIRPGTGQR